MAAQTDMEIALEMVRRAAVRETYLNAPMITTFMGYTVEQIDTMRQALDDIAAQNPLGPDTSKWMQEKARSAIPANT